MFEELPSFTAACESEQKKKSFEAARTALHLSPSDSRESFVRVRGSIEVRAWSLRKVYAAGDDVYTEAVAQWTIYSARCSSNA